MPLVLASLEATFELAQDVALRLPQGALLLLVGPLGAGKTTFTRALVAALGSTAKVSSPTYTLIHEYPAPEGIVVHIDAYRLENAAALLQLGLEDYLARARVVVVEWGGVLAEAFPEAWRLELSLQDASRTATLSHLGELIL